MESCISLVTALKQHIFNDDNEGGKLIPEFKALTQQDKDDLVDYFAAEGVEVARVKA